MLKNKLTPTTTSTPQPPAHPNISKAALAAIRCSHGHRPPLKTQLLIWSGHIYTGPSVSFPSPSPRLVQPGGEGDPGDNRRGGPGHGWAVLGARVQALPSVPPHCALLLSLLLVDGTDSLRGFFFFPPLKIKKRFMSWSRASKNE